MLLLYVCLCAFAAAHAQNPAVNTSQGVIVGSSGIDGIISFYGIHYAGSPSGENRFKAPTPPPVYPGEFHAVDNSVICAHATIHGLTGVEDCLVLGIHTNNLTSLKPVIVWLDGENYETPGDPMYSFNNLVNQNLVVVSVNYRLSIFGFLCLGVADAPGNAGLKDVIQALKWINVNIAGFGGDPNNVVLLGHGSGAAMADLVTLSPASEGLVQKAIVLSGSAVSPWAVAYSPISYAEALGKKLGYTGKTNDELAKLLSTTDVNVLASALRDFEFYNNTPLFAPCIENVDLNPNDTFLSDAPINILKSGNYSHIPFIFGYTDREGTLRAGEAAFSGWLDKMQANFSDFLQADLRFKNEANKTAVAQTIREFYFSQRAINMETIEDYLDYQGDTLILISVIRGARERALTSSAAIRIFEFAFKGTRNSHWAYPQIPLTGVRHGGILNYIFDFDLKVADDTAKTSLTRRLAEFAHTGSQSGYPNFTMWEPITNSFMDMLYIGGGEVGTNTSVYNEEAHINFHRERTNFWDNITATYYVAPSPVSAANAMFSFTLIVLVCQFFLRSL